MKLQRTVPTYAKTEILSKSNCISYNTYRLSFILHVQLCTESHTRNETLLSLKDYNTQKINEKFINPEPDGPTAAMFGNCENKHATNCTGSIYRAHVPSYKFRVLQDHKVRGRTYINIQHCGLLL